jgi:hypothetical protein
MWAKDDVEWVVGGYRSLSGGVVAAGIFIRLVWFQCITQSVW